MAGDDEAVPWQDRVSSDFDRLVAFATELHKTRRPEGEVSPKRERETDSGGHHHNMSYHDDYKQHMKKDDRRMKNEREYPANLSQPSRMMQDNRAKSKHMDGP